MSELLSERDRTIDFKRSIACMAVVLMHVVATFWYRTPVRYLSMDEYYAQQSEYISEYGVIGFQSAGWYVCSLIDAFTRFSVPCYVIISGTLVLNKVEIPKSYLWKKFKHIVKIIVS